MAHAENEVAIGRSPEDVYAFLADGLNNPKWRPAVVSISLQSGSAGEVGAVYEQTMQGRRGKKIAGNYEITAADPGKLLAFKVVSGPANPTGRYELSQTENGTRLRFSLDLAPKGIMRMIDGVITKTMAAEVSQLAELKTVLETAAP